MPVAGREVIKLQVESANLIAESDWIGVVWLGSDETHGGDKAVDLVH